MSKKLSGAPEVQKQESKIKMPKLAESFLKKQADGAEATRAENQKLVEAYAALISWRNSEDGFVLGVEEAKKDLLELVNARQEIETRWRFNCVWEGQDGAKYVRMGSEGRGTNVTDVNTYDNNEIRRRKEILENFQTIETIFRAYENLQEIFKAHNEHSKELFLEAEQRRLEDNKTEQASWTVRERAAWGELKKELQPQIEEALKRDDEMRKRTAAKGGREATVRTEEQEERIIQRVADKKSNRNVAQFSEDYPEKVTPKSENEIRNLSSRYNLAMEELLKAIEGSKTEAGKKE